LNEAASWSRSSAPIARRNAPRQVRSADALDLGDHALHRRQRTLRIEAARQEGDHQPDEESGRHHARLVAELAPPVDIDARDDHDEPVAPIAEDEAELLPGAHLMQQLAS